MEDLCVGGIKMQREISCEDYTLGTNSDEMLVLTPSAILAFLSEIEELQAVDISLEENENCLNIMIGDNVYKLESSDYIEVPVADEVVDTISELNEEGYQELMDGTEVSTYQDEELIEGGIIKELIKTLAIGGLVRLTKDALTK